MKDHTLRPPTPARPGRSAISRLTKGAIATAAGVTLLLGGAGTFALWNDVFDGGVANGTIVAGQLQFKTEEAISGQWWDVSAEPEEINLNDFFMVPGDTVEFRGTVDILASGTNLQAVLGVDRTTIIVTDANRNALADVDLDLVTSVALTGGGDVITKPKDGGVEFTLTIHWPAGTAATPNQVGQNARIDLQNVQFTLTQTRPGTTL